MQRAGEEIGRAGHFHHLPGVHQRHAVRHLRDDGQVVGNEQQRHVLRALQVLQQLQNLRLDGHVQRRGGLVGDQHLGLGGQGNGNHHALLLPARELVWVAQRAALGRVNADAAQPVYRFGGAGRARERRVALNHFLDLPAHGHHRVEAGGWFR